MVILGNPAGRLHFDGEMMTEIQDIAEALKPVKISYLFLDGMTGKMQLILLMLFLPALPLTGTILTKLDGDARGGAAVSIAEVTGVPIKFIGISEKMDGLEVFDPKRIADRILGFGDVVSLVEKAKDIVDETEAKKLEKKLKDATFDLEDFRSQLDQLKKMGPLNQIVGMMPGMNRKMMKGLDLDDRQLSWTVSIISSMTPAERKNPSIIDGSRRSRISKGSGRPVQEINQFLKTICRNEENDEKNGQNEIAKKFKTTNDGIKLRRRRFVNKNQIKTYGAQKRAILSRICDGFTKP
ncbi:MAG: hypothetical protein CM1200mP16_12550 [Nitrospina sp.]|nr:MAG: hypothetical protein CM1200mP16_12550 [Nitrospina sp.]